MKKILLICSFLFAFSCSIFAHSVGMSTIISPDGNKKVNLTGTWKAHEGSFSFTMIFDKDGNFTYGCNNEQAPMVLSFGDDADLHANEYNQWHYKGLFETDYDIINVKVKEVKNPSRNKTMPYPGDRRHFKVTIISSDEIIIQTLSNNGATRTYIRQSN